MLVFMTRSFLNTQYLCFWACSSRLRRCAGTVLLTRDNMRLVSTLHAMMCLAAESSRVLVAVARPGFEYCCRLAVKQTHTGLNMAMYCVVSMLFSVGMLLYLFYCHTTAIGAYVHRCIGAWVHECMSACGHALSYSVNVPRRFALSRNDAEFR